MDMKSNPQKRYYVFEFKKPLLGSTVAKLVPESKHVGISIVAVNCETSQADRAFSFEGTYNEETTFLENKKHSGLPTEGEDWSECTLKGFAGVEFSDVTIPKIAEDMPGENQPYSLDNNNCQHYATTLLKRLHVRNDKLSFENMADEPSQSKKFFARELTKGLKKIPESVVEMKSEPKTYTELEDNIMSQMAVEEFLKSQ